MATRKKNRKLRKTIRKTLSAIFLASAVFVASMPVSEMQAAVDPSKKVSVDIENCQIPIIDEGETIYTTGDGMFQFAYVNPNDVSAGNKIAVILGYDGGRREGGVLTIPDSVDAYLKYSENMGTAYGYCAVARNKEFLYYQVVATKKNEYGEIVYEDDLTKPILDEDGNPVLNPITGAVTYEQKEVKEIQYQPCLYEDYDKWKDLEVDKFYHVTSAAGVTPKTYGLTTDSACQRIQAATVRYIGNQQIRAGSGAGVGTWSIIPESEGGYIDTPEEGIFRGEKAGNVEHLYVGSELSGIGDYAFYGCMNLKKITLENGLDTIGNYAFANCRNMSEIELEITSRISTIGDHAFYHCESLTSFTMPRQVSKVGDSAFEGCVSLKDIELCGAGARVNLEVLGYSVFKNCKALESITFPSSYEEDDVNINMFEGCKSLKTIKVQSDLINFVETPGGSFGFNEFKNTVLESFYFEGIKNSPLHVTATDHSIAFKYDGSDVYEVTIVSPDGKEALYQVNSNNELIKCVIPSDMKEVVLPSTIGPYTIKTIWSTSFQGNCFLEKISIPSSITNIESNAFKGCHNLRTVVFEEPVQLTNIGAGAFDTQNVLDHKAACTNTSLPEVPTLQFVGPISSDSLPFRYAMNAANYFNNSEQRKTYITYYSSWPTNLVVQYNDKTDKNELINYPTFQEFQSFNSLGDPESLSDAQIQALINTYPSITSANVKSYVKAVQGALAKNTPALKNTMTMNEEAVIDAALHIELPDGIESFKSGLFADRESSEIDCEKTLVAYSLDSIGDQAFKGFRNLTSVSLYGNTSSIGSYAFQDCEKLTEVNLPASVRTLGTIPFTGCSDLSYVNFSNNTKYVCKDSIIYEKDSDGVCYKIIEYLEGNENGVLNAEDLEGVSEIAEEAFAGDGVKVSYVDLRNTTIREIPEGCFKDTQKLSFVYLPTTWDTIAPSAFENSSLIYLEIPGSSGYIDTSAFNGHETSLTFNCEEDSNARRYALKNNIRVTDKEPYIEYVVRFWDYDNTLLKEEVVVAGKDANPPETPEREGYKHTGWNFDYTGIERDMDIVATYEAIDPDIYRYTVRFIDWDDTVLSEQRVDPGKDAEAPADPVRAGYEFIGWRPAITNIQKDTDIYAQYVQEDPDIHRVTVRFIDWNDSIIKTERLDVGTDATPPETDPKRDGYVFTGWRPSIINIQEDTDIYAQYEKEDPDANKLTVKFEDYDGRIIKTVLVAKGGSAETPLDPVRDGYTFTGWKPSVNNIQENTTIYAQYEKNDSTMYLLTVRFIDWNDNVIYTQKVAPGEDCLEPKDPSREGYTFTGWRPAITNVTQDMDTYAQYEKIVEDNSNNGNNNNENNNQNNTTQKFRTLTVVNGSGSGSYMVGSQAFIYAEESDKLAFSSWTVDADDLQINSKVLNGTIITMPDRDVTVIANFVTKDNNNNNGGENNNNNNNNNGNNNGNNNNGNGGNNGVNELPVANGGTTVVIDKNGLSNTGVVSAVINGSSDNFRIKITGDSDSSEAIVRALMKKYGTLDCIKYFPMKISLYDSTGKKQIYDTTGLSISVTLPIPDSLIPYAGNNLVAYVPLSGEKMKAVDAKFTTIDNVPCISFKAEDFGPYVIYVNTEDLSAGNIADSTPKTGDGIHPKWFLSLGLAAVAAILFFYQDKRKGTKKVARA